MYSFSGWNAATYIIGEVRLPERNVPRAMLIGTLIVLVLYVALNAVFLHTAPIDKLAGQLDVARISGSYIFGEFGGRIVGAMICFGLISSISAMMWIGPRVMMTMGEDIPVLRAFARRSAGGAPAYAILFQLMVASLMLFTRSFEAVLDFIQFALLFCSFFTVLGVIKLRITQPDLPRPYRAWGYPVTPVIFLLVTGFMMYYLLTERPLQSALGILIMLSGLSDLRRLPQAGRSGPRGRIRGSRMNMMQSLRIATLAAAMLVAAASFPFAPKPSLRRRHREISGRHDAVGGFAADCRSPGRRPGNATPNFSTAAFAQLEQRQLSRIRAWTETNLAAPRAGHVLHVLRSGLPVRERVLFQGLDLRAERTRAGRVGA